MVGLLNWVLLKEWGTGNGERALGNGQWKFRVIVFC